jgi:hypothetical protein
MRMRGARGSDFDFDTAGAGLAVSDVLGCRAEEPRKGSCSTNPMWRRWSATAKRRMSMPSTWMPRRSRHKAAQQITTSVLCRAAVA